MIVTIDGPAGSGKSTVAELLAKKLMFFHLNSGQIYRALTAQCLDMGLFKKGDELIEQFVQECDIRCFRSGERQLWSIDRCDVTDQLLKSDVVQHVSHLAALEQVRKRVGKWQREWAVGKNAVVEGRDAGSSVFSSALVKIYLTAALATRAKRRWDQLIAKDGASKCIDLRKVEIDLARRDRLDQMRKTDPLIVPKGAIYLDTTAMSAEGAAAHLYSLVRLELSLA